MAVEIDQTVAHLRTQATTRRARAQARAAHLRRFLPEARRLLQEEYGAHTVWLFGSLATGQIHEASDVDLAVEGLPADRLLDAAATMMRLFPCDVDLVRLEEAPPSLRDRVRVEGEVL